MVLFLKDCQFTVDLTSKHFPYKRKQEIRRRITDYGGTISYILNNKTKFFVSENKDITETYKGRIAVKLGIPIVSLSFIDDCAQQQKLLDSDEYLLVGKSAAKQFSSGIIKVNVQKPSGAKAKLLKPLSLANLKSTRVYLYNQESDTVPFFPTEDYEIIKYTWYKKTDKNGSSHFVAIELHVSTASESASDEKPQPSHRIFAHLGIIDKGVVVDGKQETRKECRFTSNSDSAEQLYSLLCEQQQSEYRQQFSVFPFAVGSNKMISNNISSQISNKDSLSPSLKALVHSIWSDAIGELTSLLSVSVERLKLQDIGKAEGILQAIREISDKKRHSQENLKKYSDEFYSLIPHNEKNTKEINTKRVIAEKQDLCQLIKDMLNVSEATNFSSRSSDEAKYKALGCHLEKVSESSDEYMNIVNRVQSTSVSDIKVQNVFTCQRPVEAANFQQHIGNVTQLFHSSKAQNFLGILSRGLLLPKVVVSDYGGERSDAGSLGTGIYFGLDASTSVKYSSPGLTRGSRFLLICDVALGSVKDFTEFARDLESAPEGYQSCHGVKNKPEVYPTHFQQDEYVIYSINQQRITYLVEFSLPGDDVMVGVPDNITGSDGENILCEPTTAISLDEKAVSSEEEEDIPNITTSDIENLEDPLDKVKPGLRFEGDTLVPLQCVHIRAKLLDLCAKVVVMQVYNNSSSKPIEAKYVFPLDDMAAVCGFEAFINGKHIVGEVKEKEEAHREYKKAISEGHGAYLMDEETPDVFTVSVGNIPPGATVLIKITYVAELPVEDENIVFSLPGSLAPWSRDQALKDRTQDVLESVKVDVNNPCELSIHVAVEMPFDIRTLDCPTHDVKMKKTAAKAVIQMKADQDLGTGFQLLVGLAEIHVPRMWVERLPEDSDSQACMLSFYPEFEAEPMDNIEYVFLLDVSCSMKGTPLENAKKILLLTLHKLPTNSRFNVIAFGSHWLELFPASAQKSEESLKDAATFIKRCSSDMGATDIWKVLKALSLLPVKADVHVRNVCLLSDGHVTEEELSLKLASHNHQQSRIFTFGVGSSANRYFLRTMAKVGAGASEYFDSKVKSKWQRKVQSLLSKSQQPVLTSVSVAWQQYDNDAPTPIQAPSQILSLFNGSRQVVYGFVPYCTQATLKAEINGKEISTMVSTSDLSITSGSTLHQLTARALINDWEEGLLAPDHLHHQAVKISRKDYIIEISKKHSVTSKFTSFVAIEKREEGETFDSAPDVEEILDGESVDILGYIGWLEDSEVEDEEEYASFGLFMDFDMPVYSLTTAGDIPVYSKSSHVDEDEDLYEDLLCEEMDEPRFDDVVIDSRVAELTKLAGEISAEVSSQAILTNAISDDYRGRPMEVMSDDDYFFVSDSSDSEWSDSDGLGEKLQSSVIKKKKAPNKKKPPEPEQETYEPLDQPPRHPKKPAVKPPVEIEQENYEPPELQRRNKPVVAMDPEENYEDPNQISGEQADSDEFEQEDYEIPDTSEIPKKASFGARRSLVGHRLPQLNEKALASTFSLTLSSDSSALPSNRFYGSSLPQTLSSGSSAFAINGLFGSSRHTTLSSDSSALGSNQLFGSSLPQSQARLVTLTHHSAESSVLPRQQSAGSGGHDTFSVKSSLEEPVARMKLGATEEREKSKEEEPDFFSLAQRKGISPKEKHEESVVKRQAKDRPQEERSSSVCVEPKPPKQQQIRAQGFSFDMTARQLEAQLETASSTYYDVVPSSPQLVYDVLPPQACYDLSSSKTLSGGESDDSDLDMAFDLFPDSPSSYLVEKDTCISRAQPRHSEVPGGLGKTTVYGSDDKHVPPESPPPLPVKSARIAVKAKPYKSTPQLSITPEASPPESTVIPPQLPPRKPKIPETPDESIIILQPRPRAPRRIAASIPPPPPLPPNTLSNNAPLPPPPSLPRPKMRTSSLKSGYAPRASRENLATKRRSKGQVLQYNQKSQVTEQEHEVILMLGSSAALEKASDTSEAKMKEQKAKEVSYGLSILQHEDGSWTLPDSCLDNCIGIETGAIERLLIECGAKSLGTRIYTILCKMLATLLVLAYLRHHKPAAFPLQLKPPFKMHESSDGSEVELQAKVAKALTWLKTADKLVPCACTRLQLGNNWEEVIPKLLGLESLIWV